MVRQHFQVRRNILGSCHINIFPNHGHTAFAKITKKYLCSISIQMLSYFICQNNREFYKYMYNEFHNKQKESNKIVYVSTQTFSDISTVLPQDFILGLCYFRFMLNTDSQRMEIAVILTDLGHHGLSNSQFISLGLKRKSGQRLASFFPIKKKLKKSARIQCRNGNSSFIRDNLTLFSKMYAT